MTKTIWQSLWPLLERFVNLLVRYFAEKLLETRREFVWKRFTIIAVVIRGPAARNSYPHDSKSGLWIFMELLEFLNVNFIRRTFRSRNKYPHLPCATRPRAHVDFCPRVFSFNYSYN